MEGIAHDNLEPLSAGEDRFASSMANSAKLPGKRPHLQSGPSATANYYATTT